MKTNLSLVEQAFVFRRLGVWLLSRRPGYPRVFQQTVGLEPIGLRAIVREPESDHSQNSDNAVLFVC